MGCLLANTPPPERIEAQQAEGGESRGENEEGWLGFTAGVLTVAASSSP